MKLVGEGANPGPPERLPGQRPGPRVLRGGPRQAPRSLEHARTQREEDPASHELGT